MIDPVLQQMIVAMAASGFALPDPMTPASMRALMDAPAPALGPPIQMAEVREVQVSGGAGPIAARLYHPHPGQVLPVTVLMHGGGWVLGTLDTHDSLARAIARDADCAVLSLDYRRAPEHPFPAAPAGRPGGHRRTARPLGGVRSGTPTATQWPATAPAATWRRP